MNRGDVLLVICVDPVYTSSGMIIYAQRMSLLIPLVSDCVACSCGVILVLLRDHLLCNAFKGNGTTIALTSLLYMSEFELRGCVVGHTRFPGFPSASS
jgi:hypothetical protein